MIIKEPYLLTKQPNAGVVWNNLGVAYREIGKRDDAISSFRAAAKFVPQMAEAWNNLGVALDKLNLTEISFLIFQVLPHYFKVVYICFGKHIYIKTVGNADKPFIH